MRKREGTLDWAETSGLNVPHQITCRLKAVFFGSKRQPAPQPAPPGVPLPVPVRPPNPHFPLPVFPDLVGNGDGKPRFPIRPVPIGKRESPRFPIRPGTETLKRGPDWLQIGEIGEPVSESPYPGVSTQLRSWARFCLESFENPRFWPPARSSLDSESSMEDAEDAEDDTDSLTQRWRTERRTMRRTIMM